MAKKHVVVFMTHAPYGSIWYTEGLRAAVGVTSGIDEHSVDVIYLGDGVQFALKGVERTDSNKYLGSLAKGGYKLWVDQDSLTDRGIKQEEVAGDVNVVPRSQVLSLMAKADHTIDF